MWRRDYSRDPEPRNVARVVGVVGVVLIAFSGFLPWVRIADTPNAAVAAVPYSPSPTFVGTVAFAVLLYVVLRAWGDHPQGAGLLVLAGGLVVAVTGWFVLAENGDGNAYVASIGAYTGLLGGVLVGTAGLVRVVRPREGRRPSILRHWFDEETGHLTTADRGIVAGLSLVAVSVLLPQTRDTCPNIVAYGGVDSAVVPTLPHALVFVFVVLGTALYRYGKGAPSTVALGVLSVAFLGLWTWGASSVVAAPCSGLWVGAVVAIAGFALLGLGTAGRLRGEYGRSRNGGADAP